MTVIRVRGRALPCTPARGSHGEFFDGWGRRADPGGLPDLAAAQTARSGWAKIIADWRDADDHVPVDVLREIVARVHAVGGRVAVHSQQRGGGAAAVEAGVDALEHGMWLDQAPPAPDGRPGHGLTPTLSVLQAGVPTVSVRKDYPAKRWYLDGVAAHPALTAAAAEGGVTLLAGTDSRPHGRIAAEVRALAAAGVAAHDSLAAASWSARAYLGLPGLEPAAPADAVVYAADPRTDLAQLDHPVAVILRGVRVR